MPDCMRANAGPSDEATQWDPAEAPTTEETPEGRLHAQLYAAESWSEVVRLLHEELGLGKADIARAADVSVVTIGRWVDAGREFEVRSPGGLDDLRFVVLTLLADGRMRKSLLKFWLTSRDVVLGTDALSAIAQGRFEEVIAAGRAVPSMRRPENGSTAQSSSPPDAPLARQRSA